MCVCEHLCMTWLSNDANIDCYICIYTCDQIWFKYDWTICNTCWRHIMTLWHQIFKKDMDPEMQRDFGLMKPPSLATEVAWGAEDAGGDCSHVQYELFDVQQIQGVQEVHPFRRFASCTKSNPQSSFVLHCFISSLSSVGIDPGHPWSYSMRCCMILLVHPPGCHGGTGAAFAAQRADGRIITWGDDPWLRGSQFQSSSENGRQLYLILWSFTAIYILIYGICVGTFWDL